MSVDQIRGALDTIDATPREGFLADLEDQLVAAWTDGTALDDNDMLVDDGEHTSHTLHRRRWMLVAAATIVVCALGLLAVSARDPDTVETDTIPSTPAPTINPATTPPPVDEISVTADLVEVGDHLFTISMASADGRRYVLAGRYQYPRQLEVGMADQAVLAAFDDVGRELWRTELGQCPTDVAVVDDVVWVESGPDNTACGPGGEGVLTRVDSSDGRVLGQVTTDNPSVSAALTDMVGAFGSLWFLDRQEQLVRVNPDLSTTIVEPGFPSLSNGCDYSCPEGPSASSDAIWVPLGYLGVAVIDAVTNQVTTIPRDVIGHDVLKVAFDGEVTYVASRNHVTSIVDGQVRASATVGEIMYLGAIDGVFGVLSLGGQFAVLTAEEPMVVERRQTTTTGNLREIDGEAWKQLTTALSVDFHRVGLLPVSAGTG